MPDAAAAARCWARRTSRQSPCEVRSAAAGRSRASWPCSPKSCRARSFGPATAKYRELGTATNLLDFNRLGTLPTRNFQTGSFEGAADIRPNSCARCARTGRAPAAPPARSAASTSIVQRWRRTADRGVRLEYENLFALGPLCGVRDPDAVLRASPAVRRAGPRHDQRRRHDRVRHGVRGTRLPRRAVAAIRRWRGAAPASISSASARRRRRAAGRRQPPRGGGDRPRQHRLRAAGQRTGNSRLRAARAANDGAGLCRRHARRRSQSQRRVRSRFLRQGRPPPRDARSRRGSPSKPKTKPR